MAGQIKKPFISEPVLTVSTPPHWHCGRSISGLMAESILALLPAALMAMMQFGLEAARVMALACVTAVITEAICLKIVNRDISVDDYSSLLTGLLFAFLLPASAPWWLVVVGSSLSIILGRILFGDPCQTTFAYSRKYDDLSICLVDFKFFSFSNGIIIKIL